MSKIEDREAEVGFFGGVGFFPVLYAEEKKKSTQNPTNQPTNKQTRATCNGGGQELLEGHVPEVTTEQSYVKGTLL